MGKMTQPGRLLSGMNRGFGGIPEYRTPNRGWFSFGSLQYSFPAYRTSKRLPPAFASPTLDFSQRDQTLVDTLVASHSAYLS